MRAGRRCRHHHVGQNSTAAMTMHPHLLFFGGEKTPPATGSVLWYDCALYWIRVLLFGRRVLRVGGVLAPVFSFFLFLLSFPSIPVRKRQETRRRERISILEEREKRLVRGTAALHSGSGLEQRRRRRRRLQRQPAAGRQAGELLLLDVCMCANSLLEEGRGKESRTERRSAREEGKAGEVLSSGPMLVLHHRCTLTVRWIEHSPRTGILVGLEQQHQRTGGKERGERNDTEEQDRAHDCTLTQDPEGERRSK